jgi:PKHD-type hydroxylase
LVRKVTLVIQLSDPFTYEGGELVLHLDKKQKFTGPNLRGCGIMFPSNMIHEAKRVKSGTRYSLVAWFEGPK